MLEKGLIEKDRIRIGAEQELFLVDENWRPAALSGEILERIGDPHFTTELARYNLEINLDPIELNGKAFKTATQSLRNWMELASGAADHFNCKLLLTGILPTISKKELSLDFITPNPRYAAMNEAMKRSRGSDFELHLTGVDDFILKHDSVLFEACNTSFQMHLQVSPDDFTSSHNWAQAISGPMLSIASNSPLLLGRELWSETRIALFQQSVDTRSSSYALKDQQARVFFGTDWSKGSICDIYRNQISRFKILITKSIGEFSTDVLKRGEIPKLSALGLHNSTIYSWNRPCFGISNGKAHVRIENRYIPSGPTVIDEMANFAFWTGLMLGRPAKFNDLESVMDFRDAKSNFLKAARDGKETSMNWCGEIRNVKELILKEFLPIAYDGLKKSKIDKDDIEELLGIIEKRSTGLNGSQWIVKNYRKLKKEMKRDHALVAITHAIQNNGQKGLPVHQWKDIESISESKAGAENVEHIMSTQMYTVNEEDLADMALSVMKWQGINHMPVENESGRLTGLLTQTHIHRNRDYHNDLKVSEIMEKELFTVTSDTPIREAIRIMKTNEIGCLPVVLDEQLIGIITIKDVLPYDEV
ncbi:MAG: CBS domain-containing protein [Flavobacteriales bacterium]|nr:CBS domain-containing protein [Flavobacteriales bacterium]